MKLYRLLIISFLCTSLYCQAEHQDNTDENTENQIVKEHTIAKEHMVSIGHHAFAPGIVYLTARDKGAGIQALMGIAQTLTYQVFLALAPKKVMIDYTKDKDNPLFDSKITILHMYNDIPLLVTEQNPGTLFLVQFPTNVESQSILSANLNDANGNAADIIAVEHGISPHIKDKKYKDYIFAAVKPHEKNFGQPGSGIALVKIDSEEYEDSEEEKEKKEEENQKKQKKERAVLNVLDCTMGTAQGNKAYILDQSNEIINVNKGLDSISNVVLCWHPVLSRLYIGLSAKTNHDAMLNQGVQSLLVARVHNDVLSIEPIVAAHDPLFSSMFTISGPDKSIFIHHLKPYYTSTKISYLLVVAGRDEQESKKNVYALPLADRRVSMVDHRENNFELVNQLCESREHGCMASRLDSPLVYYNKFNYKDRLQFRGMPSAASAENQLPQEFDKAVVVGAGAPLPGPITTITTALDAVYVTVQEDSIDQKAGVFHSQPIFDGTGKIAAWTGWQRVAGMFEGAIDVKIGQDAGDTFIVKSDPTALFCGTQWYRKNKKLNEEQRTTIIEIINNLFSYQDGGITCALDIALKKNGNNIQASWLLFGGYKKIVLAEIAAADEHGRLTLYPNDYRTNLMKQEKNMHKVDPAKPALIEITGGVLDDLGMIECAALLEREKQSWLIVGSNEGIAVLADKDGNGLSSNETFLKNSFYFQRIGDFKQVKKLMVDHDIVYVLTNTSLHAVWLNADAIKHNAFVIKPLVTNKGFLFDAGVSDKFVLLASSQGLMINDINTGIDRVDATDIKWHKISLPRMKGYPYKFFFVTPTGADNGFSHSGQIYALVGSLTENYSAIYRLFFNEHAHDNDELIQWVPDIEFKDYAGPLYSFNNFKNIFVTDGAHQFVAHVGAHRRKKIDSSLLSFMRVHELNRAFMTDDRMSPFELGTKKATKVTSLIQNSATGDWFVTGDFGLLANY